MTHCGDRGNNEDRCATHSVGDTHLLVVADGMGGHADGELAAEAVVAAHVDCLASDPEEEPPALLAEAIRAAHRAVCELGKRMDVMDKPRTTSTAAMVRGDTVWWAHVGDSRVYLFDNGEVITRTRDHSHVESLLQIGEITPDEAIGHPMLNWVERSLGGETEFPVVDHGGPWTLVPGSVVLLCSDGFWEPLDPVMVADYLTGTEPLERILEELVRQAIEAARPNADNTTVAALRVQGL